MRYYWNIRRQYGKNGESWSFSKTVETVLIGRTIPWMFPNLHDISVNVRLTSCYHLVCDFDKERSHSFWGVVVLRNTVDHSDGVHQTWNMLHHFSLTDKSKTVVIQSTCQRDALWNIIYLENFPMKQSINTTFCNSWYSKTTLMRPSIGHGILVTSSRFSD